MFWVVYILMTICFSYLVSKRFNRAFLVFYFCLVILLTPAQIETGDANYAPSLFTFCFNLVFQQDYSLRVLRPLFLSLPICSLILWVIVRFKKIFF